PGGAPCGAVHQGWRRRDQVTPSWREAGDPDERHQRCAENDALEPPLAAIRSLDEVESSLSVGFALSKRQVKGHVWAKASKSLAGRRSHSRQRAESDQR